MLLKGPFLNHLSLSSKGCFQNMAANNLVFYHGFWYLSETCSKMGDIKECLISNMNFKKDKLAKNICWIVPLIIGLCTLKKMISCDIHISDVFIFVIKYYFYLHLYYIYLQLYFILLKKFEQFYIMNK